MHDTDVLIIGAGVVGLAVARELSAAHKNVIVVERNKSFGQETSSRNSEVIHGGMYYPEASLKARMCVKGREFLYKFCIKNNVPYKKTGKLIVAVEEQEVKAIEALNAAGRKNGVSGLKILTGSEIKELEPNVTGIAALYSPETGIVDSHSFMQSLINDAKRNGAMAAFNSEVLSIEKKSDFYKVTIKDGDGQSEISARLVINCAGLDSDTIAGIAGIDIKKNRYELHYCKGQYFRVNAKKAGLIKRLVYPVPHPKAGGLGIHATPDLVGGLRLGPDSIYSKARTRDYSVDESSKADFYASVKRFLPFIEEADIFSDTAGIRPKLQEEGVDFRDFIIKEESANGFPGFINLIGIESPGLTASLAIAEEVNRITAG